LDFNICQILTISKTGLENWYKPPFQAFIKIRRFVPCEETDRGDSCLQFFMPTKTGPTIIRTKYTPTSTSFPNACVGKNRRRWPTSTVFFTLTQVPVLFEKHALSTVTGLPTILGSVPRICQNLLVHHLQTETLGRPASEILFS